MKRFLVCCCMAVLIIVCSGQGTALVASVYWTSLTGTPQIERSADDGTNIQSLITAGLNEPMSLDVDHAAEKMYWTELMGGVKRADLNGSNVETLVPFTGGVTGFGMALDTSNHKMYWSVSNLNKIQRANLDGSNVEDVVATPGGPFGIAIDSNSNKIYWTEGDTLTIRRSNLDGSNVENLFTGLDKPTGIALDLSDQKMYWTSSTKDTGTIQRASLSGLSVETLVSTGLDDLGDIALDVTNGKMYWAQPDLGKVQRANLNGSNVEDLVVRAPGTFVPIGVALSAVVDVGPVCDFNGDTVCNVVDINLMYGQGNLLASVSVPPANAQFDLDSDHDIDKDDLRRQLEYSAIENGFATPYLQGDLDYDRDVDITDFNYLAVNFNPIGGTPKPGWEKGNGDGDNDVDITDFNNLAVNFSPIGYNATASQLSGVPEPATCTLLIMSLLSFFVCQARQVFR